MTPADLKSRRRALGLSQWQASQAMGIGERQYQYLEAGRNSQGHNFEEVPLLYALAWCEAERRVRETLTRGMGQVARLAPDV